MNKLIFFSLNSAVIFILLILPATQQPSAIPVSASGLNVAQSSGETIVVTSIADSGPGTLRQALLDAQSGDTITFDPSVFPSTAPVTIALTNSLPELNQGDLTIDASNAGVILDGCSISSDWTAGLQINSNGNTVQGLEIVNFFQGAGIVLSGGAQYNKIGGDSSVGSGPMGQGNIISNGDIGVGIWDQGTSFNVVAGNVIGADNAHGNSGSGIWISDGASYNTIGPENVITYNGVHGVEVRDAYSIGNRITLNSIHHNEGVGIYLFSGGNLGLSPPFITKFDLNAGTIEGTACSHCKVEIFSDSGDQGEVYEGQTTADNLGFFAFNNGEAFSGFHMTATNTDLDGNTSAFSTSTSGTSGSLNLQEGNRLPKSAFLSKQSQELEDNHTASEMGGYQDGYSHPEWVYPLGFKWIRISANTDPLNWQNVESQLGDYWVDPSVKQAVQQYADYDIHIILNLGVGDGENRPDTTRFRTEEDIERYTNYVRFMVRNFKDQIKYYEIWNEPNLPEDHAPWGGIALEDYANLIAKVVPAVREEHPDAKIVVGAIGGLWLSGYPGYGEYLRHTFDIDYLEALLTSGIAPIVDAVSWHPFYGNLVEDPYYQNYPQMVNQIKELAASEGFKGEYFVEEMVWRTPDDPLDEGLPRFQESVVAKYLTRSIVMHRGLDIVAGIALHAAYDPVHRLNTIMAGADPVAIPFAIQSVATNIVSYTFSLPNNEHLIALWVNDVPVDADPGVAATLTIHGFSDHEVIGIDVLYGFQQQLVTSEADGDLVIRDLLVKDYPIILRLYEPKYLFLPGIQGGADVSEGDK